MRNKQIPTFAITFVALIVSIGLTLGAQQDAGVVTQCFLSAFL